MLIVRDTPHWTLKSAQQVAIRWVCLAVHHGLAVVIMATSSAKDSSSSRLLPPKLYLDTDMDVLTGEFEGVLIGVCAMEEKVLGYQ